jgi:hypothetical protein
MEDQMANRIKTGHGHDGRMNAIARPGEATLDVHHGPAMSRGIEAQQHTRATLGKPPKAKGYNVAPHSGMHTRSRQGDAFRGGDDLSRATANPSNPLGGPPPGKVLTPVQPVPGQRSRTNDAPHGGQPGENHARGKPDVAALRALGGAVMAEAFADSASDDRMAHGYAPHVPYIVGSK